MRYGAGVTEEPLPRLYGDFELARLICANETGRIYRGFFRGFRASNVRVFSRQYTCDEAAVQTLRADLQADRVMHKFVTGGSCYLPFRVEQTVLQAMSPREGVDLATRIANRGPMPWPEARSVLLDVCRGLAYAHAQLIVHGDLKPENCFCEEPMEGDPDERPRVLVMGFGLARAYRRAFPEWRPELAEVFEPSTVFPVYMSPEQVAGEQPTVRSDIYALGVLMIHLLTGHRPRATGAPPAVERAGTPGPYRADEGKLTRAQAEVALKAVSRESSRRHPTVYDFAAALVGIDGGDPATELADFRPPVGR
ncbi:Protein kinase domain-containing protein [Nannocystis exedens]|uniref:non-specific serine/threonine protein kinase n=1 Tax=Nannocystis exedens TaxID=54 RepID=A0A1I1TR89_9BACT|nr:Serine/threonine-protein kinase PknB [Nannocystis exedens]SFD58973.1 Protein kinase domain-containing protein [Nannocystis exedens]